MDETLSETIDRYNDAWNAQDVEDDSALPPPRDRVPEPYGGGAGGGRRGSQRSHLAGIFAGWPDLRFRGRRPYVCDDFVASDGRPRRRIATAAGWSGMASTSSRSKAA